MILARFALLLLLLAPGLALAAEDSARGAITTVTPEGGRVVERGGRLDIYDAKSKRTGYGTRRGDGSWDIYNLDGSRKATIQQRSGGGTRVTVPHGK